MACCYNTPFEMRVPDCTAEARVELCTGWHRLLQRGGIPLVRVLMERMCVSTPRVVAVSDDGEVCRNTLRTLHSKRRPPPVHHGVLWWQCSAACPPSQSYLQPPLLVSSLSSSPSTSPNPPCFTREHANTLDRTHTHTHAVYVTRSLLARPLGLGLSGTSSSIFRSAQTLKPVDENGMT